MTHDPESRPDRRARPIVDAPEHDTRSRNRRRAMRVLLVDTSDRLLLFRDSDPGLAPTPTFWITPGGGVDPGETDLEAAVREVAEETGLMIAETDLVGPLAERVVVHGYSDVVTTQDELFWFVRCEPFDVSTAGHTADEIATMTAHHWWTRAELESTDEDIWPRDLLTIWGQIGPDGAVTAAMFDLGHVDESTVSPT
ncbi:NUDIX hydrolase [Knoellia subterranea]|uniref:DNA mismatch repair protein MutT n=1 Tax=Knoellia subterranea KCTC 19937 TaxID=1385521 RepID=A0A0A0JTT2_9MICO|nr:NUDIX domain-containing protein [Knoellia subterranea]KGN39071.1 DNA mismatch repair protein MutT [Knoellia subterranea KCTC 19937]